MMIWSKELFICDACKPLLQDEAQLNKAPESHLTPSYLTPTQLGENKTASAWTICYTFSVLMSRVDARCLRIMGPSSCTCYPFEKRSNLSGFSVLHMSDVWLWIEWQLSPCNLCNEHPGDNYGFYTAVNSTCGLSEKFSITEWTNIRAEPSQTIKSLHGFCKGWCGNIYLQGWK